MTLLSNKKNMQLLDKLLRVSSYYVLIPKHLIADHYSTPHVILHDTGIGYGMVVVSFLVCIYYNVIIGWSLFYLFASMQSVLPWTLCDQWWNVASSCVNEVSTSFLISIFQIIHEPKNQVEHTICDFSLARKF